MTQLQITRNIFITPFIRTVNTIQVSNFMTVVHYIAVNMMIVVFTRQIYTTHFPISHRATFIYEIIHSHIDSEHHLSIGVHIMG